MTKLPFFKKKKNNNNNNNNNHPLPLWQMTWLLLFQHRLSPIFNFSHFHWNNHTGWSGGNSNFPPQIWILLEKQIHVQVKPSYLENVARFIISIKNGSRYKLNHSNWKVSLFKLLGFCEYLAFFSPIGKALTMGPPGSESSQNKALDHTRIIPIGPYPTCPKITPSLLIW